MNKPILNQNAAHILQVLRDVVFGLLIRELKTRLAFPPRLRLGIARPFADDRRLWR